MNSYKEDSPDEPIKSFKGKFSFLSNFSPSLLAWEGETYVTVEHAFQAAKTTNTTWTEQIRQAQEPAEAKRLGRQAPLRPDWEDVKASIMSTLLYLKFRWCLTLT